MGEKLSQLLSDVIMRVFFWAPRKIESAIKCRGKHAWKTWEYSGHVQCERCGMSSEGHFGK